MSVYLDASAIVPLFVPEPSSQALVEAIEAADDPPSVSDFGSGEFASAVSRHVRMGTFSETEAIAILGEFDRWSSAAAELLPVETRDIGQATAIVRRFHLKLRFPDALHIAICANRRMTLATRDRQMADSARALGLTVQELK